MKRNIRDYDLEELKEIISKMGEKPFRAKQLYSWLHEKRVENFHDMKNLPKSMLSKLEEEYFVGFPEMLTELKSKLDGTRKYILKLQDNHIIEAVFMPYKHGNSVCISSQVGCRMGCRFCASTIDGLARNLSSGEMLTEIYGLLKYTGETISNIVIMGSGEPLDNYDNFVKFIKMVTDEKGLDISRRNITVSSCGIVPEIYKLADEKLGITLALSLHAYDDEKRKLLMPIARKYSLSEILPACQYYFDKTGRRVSFEYAVVYNENDSLDGARKLSELIGRYRQGGKYPCHVNLIPVNPIKERDFKRPDRRRVMAFAEILKKRGINVTVRREMGSDISGACGQLRRDTINSSLTGENND